MTDTTIFLPIEKDLSSIPAKGMKRAAGWLIAAGQDFATLLGAYSRAMALAYCGPFLTPAKGKKHGFDEGLEGRDPNW